MLVSLSPRTDKKGKRMNSLMKKQRGGISLMIIVLAWLTASILIACSDDERDDEVSAIRVEDSTEVLYSDGTLYYRITSTSPLEVAVAKADRNVVNVRIPDYVRIDNTKYKCTSIGAQAFYNSEFLKSVYIPNTVESIGSTAFGYCFQACINIPDSLKSISKSLTDLII